MMQQALNAVIYARYSSHNQTEQSIEGQLRDCYAFAEREGLQVVGEYIDRAITGRTDERPDFQRMIADARKQEFQRVIVWKFDRFSRDRYDSAIYKHKLKQCGVRVLSAMENVGEGDVSIILEALLEASAEQYSLDLSKKVLRGQRESRLKGTFLGGLTPIGYKLENRKLVADERTAPIVRYIFEQYAKGTSKQDIINELATRGILNRHGKPLSHSTLQTILKNKKYIGVYTHGGQDVAGGCEALIDEKTFLKVQEQLSKRKHAPAASKAVIEYLLQGKLYCGYCGFNMFGDSGRGRNGSTYRYYACRRRKKERDCKKKNEKKDFIEWYVVEQTVEYVLTPERIEYIASELVAQYKKDCGIDRIKAYEKQLDRIKAEISRLVDTLAVCPAAARQPIFDKMEQLDAEKQEAELDLSKLRISAKIQISKEHIADWLKQFCNGDALDVDFQKRIIDTFINSVYLYDDKVIIYYNIEGGKQVSYIDMIDSTEEPPFSDDAPGSSGGSDLKRPALVAHLRFSSASSMYLEGYSHSSSILNTSYNVCCICAFSTRSGISSSGSCASFFEYGFSSSDSSWLFSIMQSPLRSLNLYAPTSLSRYFDIHRPPALTPSLFPADRSIMEIGVFLHISPVSRCILTISFSSLHTPLTALANSWLLIIALPVFWSTFISSQASLMNLLVSLHISST